MATLLFREAVPGETPGSAPGNWQGEPFSLSRFGPGILDHAPGYLAPPGRAGVGLITSSIYVLGTDSEGNSFPDGSATVYVGSTPNVIAELSVSTGAILIPSAPSVQVFVLQGGVVAGYETPQSVNAADGDTLSTVRAAVQIPTSGWAEGYYQVYLSVPVENEEGDTETVICCLLLSVRAVGSVASDPPDESGSTLGLFEPG